MNVIGALGQPISKVSDLLGSIELGKSECSSAKSGASGQLSCENNQDSLSIDIDEELAKLELETVDDFGSSSAGTVNHDAANRTKLFSNEYSDVDFLKQVDETDIIDPGGYNIELENKSKHANKVGTDLILCDETNIGSNNEELINVSSQNQGLFKKDTSTPLLTDDKRQQQSHVFLADKDTHKNLVNSNSNDNSKCMNSNGAEMERNKGQVNGSVSQPGPSSKAATGSRSDVAIPG